MNKDTAPLLGEPALQQAFAELRSPAAVSSAIGRHSAAGHTQAPVEPTPKTVAQVLGEITWLMTQSPRHKAIPLRELEWLLMPAILLRQFRIFYHGEKPVGVALWALADDLVAKRIDVKRLRKLRMPVLLRSAGTGNRRSGDFCKPTITDFPYGRVGIALWALAETR